MLVVYCYCCSLSVRRQSEATSAAESAAAAREKVKRENRKQSTCVALKSPCIVEPLYADTM